jgi:hypothetical protein
MLPARNIRTLPARPVREEPAYRPHVAKAVGSATLARGLKQEERQSGEMTMLHMLMLTSYRKRVLILALLSFASLC